MENQPRIPQPNAIASCLGCGLYAFLATAAIFGPVTLLPIVGIYWGALIFAVVAVMWRMTMPCTCLGGGMVYSIIAMPILCSGILCPVLACGKFLLSLF